MEQFMDDYGVSEAGASRSIFQRNVLRSALHSDASRETPANFELIFRSVPF